MTSEKKLQPLLFIIATLICSFCATKAQSETKTTKKNNKIKPQPWHKLIYSNSQRKAFTSSSKKNTYTSSDHSKKFNPKPYHIKYSFGWKNILKAGELEVKVLKENKKKKIIQSITTGQSTGVARLFWKFNVEIRSEINNKTYIPIQNEINMLERKESTKITNFFYKNNVDSTIQNTLIKKGTTKKNKKNFYYDKINSIFSALTIIRSLNLPIGKKIYLVIWPQDNSYLISITPIKKENRSYKFGKFKTVKLLLEINKIKRKNHKLRTYKKSKQNFIWLSDDANKIPLEIQSQVFIGSITGKATKIISISK